MAEVEKIPHEMGKRVVYVDLDDEIDGTEDDFEFGVWLPKETTLPAFCSSNCNGVSDTTLDQSENLSSALCAQRGAEIVTQTPICSADAVNEITRKWPSMEPYALARPSESCDNNRSRRRRYKERSNYAKALLRSDKELEKLSRKIRLEIQQCEMLELAVEAERAANAGFANFSARASTFGLDVLQRGNYNLNLRRTITFSEGNTNNSLGIPREKMLKLVELRNVTEVIPQWKDLHSHMRTHLFRRKVQETALVFSEEVPKISPNRWNARFEHSASDIARQSFKFFGDFADMTVTKFNTHRMIQRRTLCESTHPEKIMDDDSQVSNGSMNTRFGPVLASHLSPLSFGKNVRRPLLDVPPGLVHPDETQAVVFPIEISDDNNTLDLPLLPEAVCGETSKEKNTSFCYGRSCTDDASTYLQAAGLAATEHRVFTDNRCGVGLTKCDERSNAFALCMGTVDSDEQNLRIRKTYDIPETCLFDADLIHTPRREQQQRGEIDFETPAKLRHIRGRTKRNGFDTILTPPDLTIYQFEPSSIVEVHATERTCELAFTKYPCHGPDDQHLALPSMLSTHSRNINQTCYFDKLPARRHHSERTASPMTRIASLPTDDNPVLNVQSDNFEVYPDSLEKYGPSLVVVPATQSDTFGDVCKSLDDEEKKECDPSSPDTKGEALVGRATTLMNHLIPAPCDQSEAIDGVTVSRDSENFEKMMCLPKQNVISFDLESQADESSSASGGSEAMLLFSAATWGGKSSENKLEIRRTNSWPSRGVDVRDCLVGVVESTSNNENLPFPSTTTQMGINDRTLSSDSHGMCHTFPSADENFQVAVEEMMSRLSPNAATWRKESYIGEEENNEFLNNYFYCTKTSVASTLSESTPTHERVGSGGDSFCHVIGVDAVCSGIRFIFSEEEARPDPIISRQRAVSLDGRFHEKDSANNNWLRTLESLVNPFGSSRSPELEEDPLQFDPPFLKKAAFLKD